MTTEAIIQQWSDAPAGTYNPFANDNCCEPVHYVTHDTWIEVVEAMAELTAMDSTLSDYDVFEDATIGKIVGVTCRDV